MRTLAEIVDAFTPRGKLDTKETQVVLRINMSFKDLATEIEDLVPETADRTAAIRALLQAKWATVHAATHVETSKNGK